jgi:uncharacterized damage-inducible protein DinB
MFAMPANYATRVIDASEIPTAADSAYQHVLDVYAGEINKTASVWRAFDDRLLDYRPHAKSAAVGEIFKHELLSGRRFFGEFLGVPEPEAAAVVPDPIGVHACISRLADLARARLPHLARARQPWWSSPVQFFDVERSRIWVFWRRILHSAHHRTQLTLYLRLLDRPVPPIYGPTADVTWSGADPTHTVDAARRQ